MTDFVTALATAGQAINLIKELRGVDKALSEADFKLKIAELSTAISGLQNALVDAKGEIKAKDEEMERLRKTLIKSSDTIEKYGFLFDKNGNGGPKGHAYCPVCLQKHGYMFHLTKTHKAGRPQQCPNCNAEYQITTFRHSD
jgi:rubrerythrin